MENFIDRYELIANVTLENIDNNDFLMFLYDVARGDLKSDTTEEELLESEHGVLTLAYEHRTREKLVDLLKDEIAMVEEDDTEGVPIVTLKYVGSGHRPEVYNFITETIIGVLVDPVDKVIGSLKLDNGLIMGISAESYQAIFN